MTLRIALCLLTTLVLAGNAQANEFIGDLVYCDTDADGRYNVDQGDYVLNGVDVQVACYYDHPTEDNALMPCMKDGFPGWNGNETVVTTGEVHGSIVDDFRAFLGYDEPDHPEWSCSPYVDYDPRIEAERAGRYLVRIPECTHPDNGTDTIRCSVAVDESTLPATCNGLVTPMIGGFPDEDKDGNLDGNYCTGTFPENQPLGNPGQCEAFPDDAPSDGVYRPVIQYVGGDRCSLNNDFGYTGPTEFQPDPCDIAVDLSCLVAPPPSTGDDCQGKVRRAIFEYTGNDCDVLTNTQEGKAKCEGDPPGASAHVVITKDADKIFATPDHVGLGETFQIVKEEKGQLKDFPSEIKFDLVGPDGTESLVMHTSCSKPLAVGDEFGGVKLVELETTEGGVSTLPPDLLGGYTSCEIPSAEGIECEEKPRDISIRYIGGDCTVSNPQEGKVLCSGNADGVDPVRIVFTSKDKKKLFLDTGSANVGLDDVVTASAGDADSDNVESDSLVRIYDGSNRLLQSIQFHTSCSKPLRIGDRFGAIEIVGFWNKDQGLVRDGADVTFFYEINPRYTDLYDVTLEHDLLDPMDVPGTPLEKVSKLKPLFFQTTVYVDEPGWSTVTLEGCTSPQGCTSPKVDTSPQDGRLCTAEDSLKITVAEPPPEPFVCSDAKPIDSLSMEWAGAGSVCILAYDGDAGDTLLDTIDGVDVGEVVTVTGMGGSPNDQQWEIYAAGDCGGTLLGTSQFHISCSDDDMDGSEDCGNAAGNGKGDDSKLANDWLFEGMAGDLTLDCSAL